MLLSHPTAEIVQQTRVEPLLQLQAPVSTCKINRNVCAQYVHGARIVYKTVLEPTPKPQTKYHTMQGQKAEKVSGQR